MNYQLGGGADESRPSRILRSSRAFAFPAFLSETSLLYRGQCEIVSVAAFVVGLEGVTTHGNGPAVRQIHESAGDRIGRPVVDHSENRPLRECLIAQSNKGEKGAAVDRHVFGCDLVGFRFACIDLATVNAIEVKRRVFTVKPCSRTPS